MPLSTSQIVLALLGLIALAGLWRFDVIRPASFRRATRARSIPPPTPAPGAGFQSASGITAPEFLFAGLALFMVHALAATIALTVVGPPTPPAPDAAPPTTPPAQAAPTAATIIRLGAINLWTYPPTIAAAAGAWLILRRRARHRTTIPAITIPDGLTVGTPWPRTIALALACTAAVLPVCVLTNLLTTQFATHALGLRIDPIAHETLRALFDSWTAPPPAPDAAAPAVPTPTGPVPTGLAWLPDHLAPRVAVWLVVLGALLGAPIVEELLYRGCVQSGVLGVVRTRWTAILLTSAVFTLVHVGATPWYALPGLFTLSVGLGVAYERTGRIGVPILMHVAFNGANLAVAAAVAAWGPTA